MQCPLSHASPRGFAGANECTRAVLPPPGEEDLVIQRDVVVCSQMPHGRARRRVRRPGCGALGYSSGWGCDFAEKQAVNLGDLGPNTTGRCSLLTALGTSLILLLLMHLQTPKKQLKLQLPVKMQCSVQRCALAVELVPAWPGVGGDPVRFGAHPREGPGTSAASCPSNCHTRAASITPNVSEPLSCLQYSEAVVMERCWGISVTHVTLLFVSQQS